MLAGNAMQHFAKCSSEHGLQCQIDSAMPFRTNHSRGPYHAISLYNMQQWNHYRPSLCTCVSFPLLVCTRLANALPRTYYSEKMILTSEATVYLYHHVVLPPKLPQEDDSDVAHEGPLFDMVIRALERLKIMVDKGCMNTIAFAIATVKNLQSNRDIDGNVSELQLEPLLSGLTAGNTTGLVPLEIKAQNAGILISRDREHLNFEFFELAPTNEAALRSTHLARTFPSVALRIAVERMADPSLQKCLASTIAKMATQSAPGFQPQARKNGKFEDEDRDTTAPGLVTEFLMNVITALGESTDVKGITKSTREDVLWSDCRLPWRRSPLWLLVRVSLQLWFTRNAINTQVPDSLYKAFMICMLLQLLESVRTNRI